VNLFNLFRKLSPFSPSQEALAVHRSFSQCGEDIIINFMNDNLLRKPCLTYMDIGAHDPYNLSNTAYFYQKGWRGVNIEPNPILFKKFLKKRPDDINLNIGIGDKTATLPFYILDSATMSTFSKDECDDLIKNHGFKLDKTIEVSVMSLEDVVAKYLNNRMPELLFVDAEGYEDFIIRSIDFSRLRPCIICFETVKYNRTINIKNKEYDLVDYLKTQGYELIADTYVNSIMIDSHIKE